MNHVILLGNVGKDPEIRAMTSGDRIANITIATSERWKDRATGENKEKTEWHRVVAFGGVVDVIEKHVRKGSKLLVTGQLQTRKWVDQSGQERYMTEVKLDKLEFAGDGGGRQQQTDDGDVGAAAQQQTRTRPRPGQSAAQRPQTDLDDSLPWA